MGRRETQGDTSLVWSVSQSWLGFVASHSHKMAAAAPDIMFPRHVQRQEQVEADSRKLLLLRNRSTFPQKPPLGLLSYPLD